MKLVTAAKTKMYELTYLVPASFTDSELAKAQESVQGLVKKHSGTIISSDAWGKKPLAYPIRKAGKTHTEAAYFHVKIEFTSTQAPLFERDVYLENEVLRHLFVEAEKAGEPTSAEPEKAVEA